MSNDEVLELASDLNGRGESYALVTVVRAVAPTSAYLGAQAIVRPDGTLHGWIGGGCAREVVIDSARSAMTSAASVVGSVKRSHSTLALPFSFK